MTRLVVHDKPMPGYNKWLLHQWSETDGKRGFTTRYIYEVPDDVAAEMIRKGAKVDE